MKKAPVDYPDDVTRERAKVIDSLCSSACVRDHILPADQSRQSSRWEPGTQPSLLAQELPPSSERMAEFAKRIEESAATTWASLDGAELSALRFNFRNLLRQILNELEFDTEGCGENCRNARLPLPNSDIKLLHRFTCLVSEAVAVSSGIAATRVEVGLKILATELTCFLAERSAGVTIRKNDNLFALCTNGNWRSERTPDSLCLASIQRVVERHGGQLSMDGRSVKVSFTL